MTQPTRQNQLPPRLPNFTHYGKSSSAATPLPRKWRHKVLTWSELWAGPLCVFGVVTLALGCAALTVAEHRIQALRDCSIQN